jgi:hypothetical protein
VATQTRNGPCPCGSGVKYKKCCQPKQPPETERRRIVDHRGQTMIASRGGEGPAAQVMRFAAPLLEAAGDDYQRTRRAMTLAMTFWNLALLEPDKQEEMLAALVETVAKDERGVAGFRAIAADMIARHREMFPEMHQGRPEHAEAGTGGPP